MKAHCTREDFLSAFSLVSGVCPARSPKPVITNVKFAAATNGDAVLMATDLEMGVRCTVSGVEVKDGGEVLLPPARMAAILRESDDAFIEVESDGKQTAIRGSRSKYKLTSQDPKDFPDQAGFDEDKYHSISAGLLRTMLRRTVFACDVESTHYALNGVLFETEGDRLRLVATDGRRLAVIAGTGSAFGGHNTKDLMSSVIVPKRAVELLDKILPDDADANVHVALSANKAAFSAGNFVLRTRLVEGRFPKYTEVIPTRCEATVNLSAKDMLQSVRLAAIVTSDESRGVDFSFAEGKLSLASQAAEIGQSAVELPIAYDGKRIEITFDPRYVTDMLRTLPEESTVTLDLIDHQSVALFKTDDGYTYCVMPLTKDR